MSHVKKRFLQVGFLLPLLLPFLALLIVAGQSPRCQAVPPDADDLTLQSMCREGLTASAILYATAQRDLVEKNDEQYARWTQRLIECEAQAALRSTSAAERHWSRCAELHESFIQTHPQNRRLPWLQWQALRCQLLQAQNHLAQWLAAPAATQHREQALQLIREIASGLEALESDLKIRQPLAAKLKPNDPSQAPAEQIAQLRLETVLLRCETFLARSRLYESGSRDRIAAATEVEALATSVLDRAGEDWGSRSSLEVARAAAWLELGRADEGIAQLQLLAQSTVDTNTRTRAAVTAMEWLVANQKLSQAHTFADILKRFDAGPEAELADLRLQLAELANMPSDRKEAAMSKLLERARTIGTRYGDYWQSRADSILVGSISKDSTQQTSTAMDLVTVEVRQLLAAGNVSAAIDKLVATSRNELAANRGESAIRTASQAAALLHRQQDWVEAADALQSVTQQFPTIASSAEAHLLATWSVSQALRATPQDDALQDRYETMLREHLSLWPSTNSTEKVLPWLQDWLSATKKQSQLLAIYRKLAEQSASPELVRKRLTSWLDVALSSPASERIQESELLRQAIANGQLQAAESTARSVAICVNLWPTWPEPQTAASLRQETQQVAARTTEPIDRNLASCSLLILAARDVSDNQASEQVRSIDSSQLSPIVLGTFLEACITAVDARRPEIRLPENRPAWVINLAIDDQQVKDLEKHANPKIQAASLRWQILIGKSPAEKLAQLRKVCSNHPTDAYLQMQLSEALARLSNDSVAESTSIAKRVATTNPKNSELHLWSRWRLLKNQELVGEASEAQGAAKLLLATQPLESELWKARFTSIAQPSSPFAPRK